jgi:ornithine cyclodeaminase/alanine dehydrogenase-like protein (mu-crystallin family)
MRLLVVPATQVHALLGFAECANAMRAALIAVQDGLADQPLRTVLRPDGAAGLVALMPAFLAGTGQDDDGAAYGLKAICITPGNPAAGLDTHQGVVLLSSGRTGEPLAVLNASAVTEIRTAAVSVVATELLARPDADVLAVIGTGVQGRAHVLALSQTRDLREIRLAGRDRDRTVQAAGELDEFVPGGVRPCASVQDAVAGAGIVVTATSSAEPVLRGEWLEPGMHINAVGACLPTTRELDSAAMGQGVLFADSRESLLAESGDYVMAASDGLVGPDRIRAELGEILTGRARGRVNDSEITIFESLGLAIEDLAAGALAYQKASEGTGAGTWVEF